MFPLVDSVIDSKEGEAYAPPSLLYPYIFLGLSAQKLAGEDELQNRHGERYHS